MKTTKLVLGILTIVISCFVLFQSCAAGAANALKDNGESSGTGGAFVALLMLAGGITMIASRKNTAKGGSIAGVIIFAIAAIIGFTTAGSVFKDLIVWAVVCAILAAINLLAVFRCKKNDDEQEKK
ncbi:MAG: hypothetical protein NC247_05115 [Ruminococcus flavefaciens]|nr:hypothetical protein [Ruminococcus flavefaciens]MCM1360949.1 hypothetical protein [Clostridiales bacterium]MCM1435353.1 hypothetical protein [Ruminococcus flavefaciens]